MVALGLPQPYEAIDQLIEAGDVTTAEDQLAACEGDARILEVLKVKLALATHSIPPGLAMQRLIQVMRQNANVPGAQVLYQQASSLSYGTRESSLAHSHPPPPIKPKR